MHHTPRAIPWLVSLHGGHSRRFCDHAADDLEAILDAAVERGFAAYGITEHAPRTEPERLYAEEKEMGWDVAHLDALFREYAVLLDQLIPAYADRLNILKGFEAEVVPETGYGEVMKAYKKDLGFDYMVGSVHYVAGHIIDYTREHFLDAIDACGGFENLGVQYYRTVSEMVQTLRPEVVGHFDLISLQFGSENDACVPRIKAAASEALETIRDFDAILDINTAGYRKGLGRPLPAAAYLPLVRDLNLPVCFGDDSHAVKHVGNGLEEARALLLAHGVETITCLVRSDAGLDRHTVTLR